MPKKDAKRDEKDTTVEELMGQLAALKKDVASHEKLREDLLREVYRSANGAGYSGGSECRNKKNQGVNLDNLSNREKAEVINALRNKYQLNGLLKALKIAKSSYCYQNRVLQSTDKYEHLRDAVKQEFTAAYRSYGYRRIHKALQDRGITASEKVIRRIMRQEQLFVQAVKRKKYSSYAGEISPAVPNLVNRDFHATAPNRLWLTDITEFHIPAGKVYLSPIINCFDGLPVTRTIGTSPNAHLVNTMLDRENGEGRIDTLYVKEGMLTG